jgi:hypothetical protein
VESISVTYIEMASLAIQLMALAALAAADTAPNVTAILPGLYPNELSFTSASYYQPYVSQNSDSSNASTWFQVDLGDSVPTIQIISLYPLMVIHEPSSSAPYPSSAWPDTRSRLIRNLHSASQSSLSTGPKTHDFIILKQPLEFLYS